MIQVDHVRLMFAEIEQLRQNAWNELSPSQVANKIDYWWHLFTAHGLFQQFPKHFNLGGVETRLYPEKSVELAKCN